MDLTMSMFATPADYWKARADLAELTVRETAAALGCKPDNEVMLAAAQDAVRYRFGVSLDAMQRMNFHAAYESWNGEDGPEGFTAALDAAIAES